VNIHVYTNIYTYIYGIEPTEKQTCKGSFLLFEYVYMYLYICIYIYICKYNYKGTYTFIHIYDMWY
jgi:hypothetical protein